MKNIKYLLFGILLTFLLMPNVYAKNNVEIKSITQADISKNTVEKSPPTHNGLEMNFDISFKQKDDFIKYKVIIKNETNVDYNISNDTSFNKSEFITYSYETTGLLKANSEAIVYVTITYTNEVDQSLMVNGKYPEKNRAVIKLLDKDGNPPNPNTGINTCIIIAFLLLSLLVLTILLNKKKKSNVFLTILISLFLIPSMVYAIETIKLTINVNVLIEKGYKVAYLLNKPAFYTEEELELYDTSEIQCSGTYYLGEMTDENKYMECKNLLYEEKRLYSEGEVVNLNNNINKRQIITNNYHDNEYTYYCEERSQGVYQCDDRAIINNFKQNEWWYWNRKDLTQTYYALDDDPFVMNFNSIVVNYWSNIQGSSCLRLSSNGTFTMPNHNVLFETYSLML